MRHTLNENILYVTTRDIKNLVEESLRRLSLLLEYDQRDLQMKNGMFVRIKNKPQEKRAMVVYKAVKELMAQGKKAEADQMVINFKIKEKMMPAPPSAQPTGKRRGRPPGSKNKPKVPMPATPNVTIAPPQPQLSVQPQPSKRGRKKGSLNLKTLYDIKTLKTATGVKADVAMDIPNVDTKPREIAYYMKRFVHDEFIDDLIKFFRTRRFSRITNLYTPMSGQDMFLTLKQAIGEIDRIVSEDLPHSTSKEPYPVSPYGFLGSIATQMKAVVKAIADMTERTTALKKNKTLSIQLLNSTLGKRNADRFRGLIIANANVAKEYVKALEAKIDYLEKCSGLSVDSSQNPINLTTP